MSDDKIFYIFGQHPGEDGVSHHLKGKFYLDGENFSVLEDHGAGLEGTPKQIADKIQRLKNSQRSEVVSAQDLKQGKYPNLLPSIDRPRLLPNNLQEAIQDQLKQEQNGPKE